MPTHPIVHVEIPAGDLTAASQFYADVFDWQIDTSAPSYPQFQAEGGPGGGFVTLGPAGETAMTYKPGELIVYLDTADIDATLATVEAHGGKTILPRTEIPGIGYWAVFEDPTGNRLGLYSVGEHAQSS